jgi:hypothetical protein
MIKMFVERKSALLNGSSGKRHENTKNNPTGSITLKS